MGTLRPLGEPKPVEVSFRATMSQELIERIIDEVGMHPSEEWEVTFDLKEIESPDLRRRIRQAHERYMAVKPYPVLSSLGEDPEKFLEVLEPWLEVAEAQQVEEEATEALRSEEESNLTAAFVKEMRRWVTEYGSERLQLATAGGYRSNTSYALERAKLEMPGFWVDTAEDCDWGERVDPSEDALILEASVRSHIEAVDSSLGVCIIWLTETPRALDRKMEAEGLAFEPQEALVVPGYLGRYLLVMPLELSLQRDPNEEY